MRILYLDLVSGASGDMLLGALLDAGADAGEVHRTLDGLGLPGWDLRTKEVNKNGIRATKVDVVVTDDATSRTYPEIRAIVERAQLNADVRDRALATFDALAEAEASVHGIALDDVHLHEVGGHDAIVDVVGTIAALSTLQCDLVVASPVPLGSGWIGSAHGPLPVPAPAVVELLRHVPVWGEGEGELVTPTGAALLLTIVDRFGPVPPMSVAGVGYGAGTRDTTRPNVLRVLIGEAHASELEAEGSIVVETNLDDMSPELFPHVLEMLLAAGAADAWVTPVLMKKGRPGFVLSALVTSSRLDLVRDVIFRETTTLGVRSYVVDKQELERSWIEVEIAGHPVRVKTGMRGGSPITLSPEHDDAQRVARATGLPLKEVYAQAVAEARTRVG